MIIQIEPQSDVPIYTQLTNQMIEGIARGDLQPGNSLPSVRSLAADLGVNMHTVHKSYQELEKKKIIRIVPKSGAVINLPKKVNLRDPLYKRIVAQCKPVIAEALVLGMRKEQIQALISTMIEDFQEKKAQNREE
ncbi:GntR family transcriptional regulator [Bacillaceae bacterium Marseille-Q3522]|nr:GntR family transcriptional regulator [Bacillaceae bacterium Marseille-Q3522]